MILRDNKSHMGNHSTKNALNGSNFSLHQRSHNQIQFLSMNRQAMEQGNLNNAKKDLMKSEMQQYKDLKKDIGSSHFNLGNNPTNYVSSKAGSMIEHPITC